MRDARNSFAALIEALRSGTVAEEAAATATLRDRTAEASAFVLELVQSDTVEQRIFGCELADTLLYVHAEDLEPIPAELADRAPTFIQLMAEDPDLNVRFYAGAALRWFRSQDALPVAFSAADGELLERQAALHVLTSYGPEFWRDNPQHRGRVTNTLLRLTEDPDPEMRAEAVRAFTFCDLDTPDIRARLLDSLDDPDHHVRNYAAEVLGRLRERRLVPILESRLRDEAEIRASWWGYVSAVRALREPTLLPAAEIAVGTIRKIYDELQHEVHSDVDRMLEELRDAAGYDS